VKKNRIYAWGITGFALVAAVPVAAQPLMPPGERLPPYMAGPPPYEEGLPPYEIIASVRSAGFQPLSRPLRRGPVYVLFAADRYLVDVRVIVDARSGRVLSATRLAGALYGGPGYEGHDVLPRSQALGYPPRGYERAPVPPGDVPSHGAGRPSGPPEAAEAPPPANLAKRSPSQSPQHPPLPHARPADVVTGAVKEVAPPAPPAEPASTTPAPPPPPPAAPAAAPVAAPPPQQPAMVPIAPLD
jgi:hypothetical protein